MNRFASRALALRAECSKCGAAAGEPCVGKRGPRKAPHKVRCSAPPVARLVVVKSASEKATSFYETPEWRRLRYKALTLHGAVCQCCGARPSRGKPLHVDHIKPRSKFPELELDLNNLQVLCDDCNLGKGAWDQTDWRAQ
jgi:5-methylcytosine-specific restriction endonuclease McrA